MTAKQGGGYWLDKGKEEYNSVRFYVDLCLGGNYELVMLDVWKIVNEERSLHFNRTFEGMERVISWKNIHDIPSDMLKGLGKDGFTFPEHPGMRFEVGNLPLPTSKSGGKDALACKNEYSFIYSDMILGRARAADEKGAKDGVPKGFESVWISPTSLDGNNDGVFSLTEYKSVASFDGRAPSRYQHSYLMCDTQRILPRYVIKFKIKLFGEGQRAGGSAAERARAASSFVEPSTLSIVPVNDAKNIRQGMLPAGQVYDQALIDLQEKDPLATKKQEKLNGLLASLDDKVRAINLNYAQCYDTIERAAKQAKVQLQQATRVKLEDVLSIEVELRRQRESNQWLEQYMQCQVDVSTADKPGVQSILQNRALSGGSEKYQATVATPDILDFLATYKAYLEQRHLTTRARPVTAEDALGKLDSYLSVDPKIRIFASVEAEEEAQLTTMKALGASGGLGMSQGSATGMRSPPKGVGGGRSRQPRRASSVWMRSVRANDGKDLQMAPLADFVMKAVDADLFSEPARMKNVELREEGQIVMDDAMKRITRALYEAQQAETLPLPPSLVRAGIVGNQYIIDLVKAEDAKAKAALAAERVMDPDANPNGSKLGSAVRRRASVMARNRGETKRVDLPADPMGMEVGGAMAAASAMNQGMKVNAAVDNPLSNFASSRASRVLSPRSNTLPSPPKQSAAQASASARQTMMDVKNLPIISNLPQRMNGADMQKISQIVVGTRPAAKRGTGRSSAANALAAMKADEEGLGAPAKMVPEKDDTMAVLHESSRHEEHVALPEAEAQRESESVLDFASLAHITKRFEKVHGMTSISQRRGRQFEARLGELSPSNVFHDSELLSPAVANKVYMCLPFLANPPQLKCIFSTLAGSEPSLPALYSSCHAAPYPTVLVFKSGEFVFGAYISVPLKLAGLWAGSPASFLFSATLDLRLPYHGERVPNLNKPDPSHTYGFFADVDQLVIGNGDLVINQSLSRGSSEVEGCFGVGLGVGSIDSRTVLAGANLFDIDAVEAWAVL